MGRRSLRAARSAPATRARHARRGIRSGSCSSMRGSVVRSRDDLSRATAAELAGRIRRRELSPVEVIDAAIARIEADNERLNAFVYSGERSTRGQAGRLRCPDVDTRVNRPGPLSIHRDVAHSPAREAVASLRAATSRCMRLPLRTAPTGRPYGLDSLRLGSGRGARGLDRSPPGTCSRVPTRTRP
jgi:hypothetical protein